MKSPSMKFVIDSIVKKVDSGTYSVVNPWYSDDYNGTIHEGYVSFRPAIVDENKKLVARTHFGRAILYSAQGNATTVRWNNKLNRAAWRRLRFEAYSRRVSKKLRSDHVRDGLIEKYDRRSDREEQ
jgi:hypothetical protein